MLCLKGHSHQVAICSCLFSCPHPAPSSFMSSLSGCLTQQSSFTSLTQLFRMACLLSSVEAALSSCLAHLSPWVMVPREDNSLTHSPPLPRRLLKPGLVLCCPLLAWAGTSIAPWGLLHNPVIPFPQYLKIWKNCTGLL